MSKQTTPFYDAEAINLSYTERAGMIQADAVTCARYSSKRFDTVFGHLKQPGNSVFEPYKVENSHRRAEFQYSGSVHDHSLLWLRKPTQPGTEGEENPLPPRYQVGNEESG